MAGRISAQQLAQYKRDGALFPVSALSLDDVAMFRSALEGFEAQHLDTPLKRADSLHQFFPWAYRLATHDTILDNVEVVLGPDILIDGTVVFCKPPHDNSYVSWHQDSVYSGWHKTPTTTAWIALTVSQPFNGCMRVIPGSHKGGLVAHSNADDCRNLLERGEFADVEIDESRAVDVTLRPGEMSFHHCNIIHGSNPNSSNEKRIGFIVRYVTNQIEPAGRPLMRARGHADCSHLELAQSPVGNDDQTAIEALRAFNQC